MGAKRRVAVGVTAGGLDLVARAVGSIQERRSKSAKDIATAVLDAIGITNEDVELLNFTALYATFGPLVVPDAPDKLKTLADRLDQLRPPVDLP